MIITKGNTRTLVQRCLNCLERHGGCEMCDGGYTSKVIKHDEFVPELEPVNSPCVDLTIVDGVLVASPMYVFEQPKRPTMLYASSPDVK